VTFSQTGVDSSAGSNTVLTVGSTNYAYNALPTNAWLIVVQPLVGRLLFQVVQVSGLRLRVVLVFSYSCCGNLLCDIYASLAGDV